MENQKGEEEGRGGRRILGGVGDNRSRRRDGNDGEEKKKKSDQLDANEMPNGFGVTSGEDSPVGLYFDT